MNKTTVYINKFIAIITATAVLCIFSSCRAYDNPAKDAAADQFSGKTVGVMLAWDSDYALTPRKDINLLRYDNMSDMVMALQHNRIDAIALDEMTAKTVLYMVQGLEVVYPGYGNYGYVAAFGPKNKELCDDYNAFLSEYIKSEDYQDLQRRIHEYDGVHFDGKIIKPTGTGRTIKLACHEGGFPSTYYDQENNCWMGFDYEPLVTWANERNYKIEIAGSLYDDMMIGVSRGRYDVIIGYLNELYEDDFDTFEINHSIPLNQLVNYYMVKSENGITPSDDFYDEYE
jgi:hypothetical protein